MNASKAIAGAATVVYFKIICAAFSLPALTEN